MPQLCNCLYKSSMQTRVIFLNWKLFLPSINILLYIFRVDQEHGISMIWWHLSPLSPLHRFRSRFMMLLVYLGNNPWYLRRADIGQMKKKIPTKPSVTDSANKIINWKSGDLDFHFDSVPNCDLEQELNPLDLNVPIEKGEIGLYMISKVSFWINFQWANQLKFLTCHLVAEDIKSLPWAERTSRVLIWMPLLLSMEPTCWNFQMTQIYSELLRFNQGC